MLPVSWDDVTVGVEVFPKLPVYSPIRVSGPPFRAYFNEDWDEIWRRGTWLNSSGAHDLSAVKSVAQKLGLPAEKWTDFVKEAKELQIGDGAPPLV